MFSKLVTKARKEMPIFLLISAILWVPRFVSNFDGRFTPLSWVMSIALTAFVTFIVMSGISCLFVKCRSLLFSTRRDTS